MSHLDEVKARLERYNQFVNRSSDTSPEWDAENEVSDQFTEDFIQVGQRWLGDAFREIERLQAKCDEAEKLAEEWRNQTIRGSQHVSQMFDQVKKRTQEIERLQKELDRFYECDDDFEGIERCSKCKAHDHPIKLYRKTGEARDFEELAPHTCRHGHLAKSCYICKLEAENAELKTHIQRWAKPGWMVHAVIVDHPNDSPIGKDCHLCRLPWPCPTAVAEGFKER